MTTDKQEFWFNTKTGQVEEGKQSLASDLLGPFGSSEEAARAPERLQENARTWAEEEAREEAE
ncbi:SPOR domain-containing protein [Pseudoclavibacter alba]|uniref:SPOR domain-containing protein n=1 Tax=Pseudoclavibacter albus TaxID=272241 RepID=A0ABT2HVX9_9MICO|nr:hypothetical protein [Pseudoclavibacter alba]MBN6777864.1 SPOR domain-containing protein [Pseudoclavibacter alba]MCT2042475.1 SPOR domain-containing protein [Pseudoclavibacter alba]